MPGELPRHDHDAHLLKDSEVFAERLFFTHRKVVLLVFAVLTVWLGLQAAKVKPDASFEKMIPTGHPFIANYLADRDDLKGLGNVIRIAVETREGDIFQRDFLDTLKQISDEAFFIPGVDRSGLKSLWTPNMRWTEVTEEGLAGGPVMPDTYDGSPQSLQQVRKNVLRSGQVGRLVANDFKSTIILVPLLENNPQTGERLDYQAFSRALEDKVRDKYQDENLRIHITGFAKVVGDLIDGAEDVALFFAVACGITLVLLFLYSCCWRSSLAVLLCSGMAVLWQLGLLNLMGLGLDPYSMLVPFLVFAIAVSHGVQMFNAVAHGGKAGLEPEQAARRGFRRLYLPGLTALVSDGIGFATLWVIEISVIRDLAIAASTGVAVIILTNLVLLPVIMSYIRVGRTAVERLDGKQVAHHRVWRVLSGFAGPRLAPVALGAGLGLFAFGWYAGQELQIGDLDEGAPELRADSRYNLDNRFVVENYSASTDVFVVMVHTPPDQCVSYETLATVDYFQWYLADQPGVQSVVSLVDRTKRVISALNEGSLKWMALSRNQLVLNGTVGGQQAAIDLYNADCSMLPVLVFLEDHRATTLQRVVEAVNRFTQEHDTGIIELRMAAGNAGIEAATNIVVAEARYEMLAWVYAVVCLLVLLAFRSLRAVICIVLPLALTSVLGQALMVFLGIGVKVATLPVIALGVGIGVDYGIYIYSRLQTHILGGNDLPTAYFKTLIGTGKAVAFTGITLAIGVATWAWSPIKFQADMGVMLTFMFLWNMLGAVILLPALARYLLDPEKLRRSGAAREQARIAAS
jgi:predicted RND superfamily exporter protein